MCTPQCMDTSFTQAISMHSARSMMLSKQFMRLPLLMLQAEYPQSLKEYGEAYVRGILNRFWGAAPMAQVGSTWKCCSS